MTTPRLTTLKQVLVYSLILQGLFIFSCTEKDIKIPTASSEFVMDDSLKIAAAFSTGPFAEIFNQYNGKVYHVNSVDRVGFDIQKVNSDIIFRFSDSSVNMLVPVFTLTIKNTQFQSLLPEYDLTNSSLVSLADGQRFPDGSSASQFQTGVLKGKLKISYSQQFNQVSGVITDLKIPVGYYVPEDISVSKRSSNGILIQNGGSTRTVNLKFSNVHANSR